MTNDSSPRLVAEAARHAPHEQSVERERAEAFGRALRVLLQRQRFYVPLTSTYLLPQFSERLRTLDGQGISVATLRAYLRGESFPTDGKVRLLADGLSIPRGAVLYLAGYLTPEDLPHYPGPQTTLAAVEADIQEVEHTPLARATKEHILRDLRITARLLHLLAAEQAQHDFVTAPDEREQIIELLIEVWETATPPPPPLATSEEAAHYQRHPTPALRPVKQPVAPASE